MRRILILFAAAVLCAGSAHAQPGPWLPDRLSAGWTLTPSIVLGTLWDSNVTVRNQGNPQLREWVMLANPRGEIDFNGRHTRFNAGYSGALEAYRQFSELNRYEQRGRLSYRQDLSQRFSVEGHGSYTLTPSTDRLELGTLPFIDIGSRLFDAGASAKIVLSTRTDLQGDYRYQWVRFERNGEQPQFVFLNGGESHSPGVRLSHRLTRRLSVGADWQYRHAVLQGVSNTFDIQNALGAVSYALGESTSVTAGAGTSHLSVAATDLSLWGPAFRAGIAHHLNRVTVSAGYSKQFVPSFSFGGLSGNQQFEGGVVAPLTREGRLTLRGNVTYSRTSPVRELEVGFQLDTFWTTTSLGYQITPWLRSEGFITAMHQESSARGNIDRTRVGIQFVTSKPMRIE